MIDKERIRLVCDQTFRELEQASKMMEFLNEQMTIHLDLCNICKSRQFCLQHNQMRYRMDKWQRIEYWSILYNEGTRE